jgi:hypothetical protein
LNASLEADVARLKNAIRVDKEEAAKHNPISAPMIANYEAFEVMLALIDDLNLRVEDLEEDRHPDPEPD